MGIQTVNIHHAISEILGGDRMHSSKILLLNHSSALAKRMPLARVYKRGSHTTVVIQQIAKLGLKPPSAVRDCQIWSVEVGLPFLLDSKLRQVSRKTEQEDECSPTGRQSVLGNPIV